MMRRVGEDRRLRASERVRRGAALVGAGKVWSGILGNFGERV